MMCRSFLLMRCAAKREGHCCMQIWNGWNGIGNVTVRRGEKDVCMLV
jgi:hypothetical protein